MLREQFGTPEQQRETATVGSFNSEYYTPLDVVGLYWHFVDIVWVFLFAIFYISGLHK